MKQKLNPTLYLVYVYQAVLIVAAGLIVILARTVWGDLSLSENLVVLGVLLLSAILVEARLVRWTVVQYTTLFPTVLLLTLMLTRAPVPVIAISGVGTFIGYGLLREFPAHIRQVPGRTIQRVLFYTAQSIVAATVAGGLYSLLPDLMLADLMLNAAISFFLVVIYILLSKGFVWVFNRLVSSCWPGDISLPTPNFLVFFLTATMPFITMLFYQIASGDRYVLFRLLGQEGVRVLAILCVWPLALALAYIGSSFLRLGLESEEVTKEYGQFLRYSEKMLDIAGVTQLIAGDMKAQFGCDDCIIYSWNDKRQIYELEPEGQPAPRISAQAIPDAGWPKVVEPGTGPLGKEVHYGELRFFQGRGAQDLLERIDLSCPHGTSVLLIPLNYVREGSHVRAGFIVLVKRRGAFAYTDRLLAENRLVRKTHPTAIGLRQARLYRDARQFFVKINETVSRSAEVLAATQSLFAKGIDPAKFMTGVGKGVQDYTLIQIAESVSRGHFPGAMDEVLDEKGIESLYKQIRQGNPNIRELTQEIKDDIRTVVSSLSMPFMIPYRFPRPEYGEITPEMRTLYSFFSAALKANTIEDIIKFSTRLGDGKKPSQDLSRLTRDFSEVVNEFSRLKQVIQTVKLSRDSKLNNEVRVDHLSEALRMLDRASSKVPGSTEQFILAQIRNLWATVIYNKREELMGWSDLTMQLETQSAIPSAEGIIVDLRVGNRGRSAATDITVRIANRTEYDILTPADGRSWVEKLEPGQNQQLDFRVRPRREDFVRLAFEAVWNDRVRVGHTISYAGRVTLKPQAEIFVFIENPYIPGPPLRPGSGLFVGREDVFDFVRNNIGTRGQHNVLLLTGQRRTGKTSIALRMPEKSDPHLYVVVYVDGQALGIEPGAGLFLRDLGVMICDGLEDYDIECEPFSLDGAGRSVTEKFEREFLPAVFDAIGERSLVLVFDEFEELENRVREKKLDATIFKFLRHLMQHTPNLAFVLIGSHRLQELTRDYWSIFFDLALHKQIGFLDEEAARRLITEPPEQDVFDPYAVDEIIRLTAGHPYFVQLVCHYMVDLRNRSRSPVITVQHVRDAIPDILVQAEGHLTHLWHTASPLDQMVMASAARVLAGQDSVQASDLVEQLVAYRVDQKPQDVLLVEEALAGREIFERLDGDPPRYKFKVELIRRWIERNQSLSVVVGSLT